ncbi:MAG: hypothetical protein M3384_01015 [Acidobacteriota bacterium]|nr:hypothetical protein [Acidobacteriota bacterium]
MKGKRQTAEGENVRLSAIGFGFFNGKRFDFFLNNGKSKNANGIRFLFFAFCLFTSAFAAPATALAQPEEADVAPPPMKFISKEEKQQLDGEPNVKKYTQLALNLMEARLKTAETQTTENNYREALNTLGGFQILLENTLGFLSKNDIESGKVQNNLKKLEMSLREQTSRLEIMRRAMPSRYGFYVQKLIRLVRDARSKAIEPLFSDTVVAQPRLQQQPQSQQQPKP